MKKFIFFLVFVFATNALFSQVPSYVPTSGLVAYYPFNGNAIDESGNGNNGTNAGATLGFDRNGIENSAFNFNGTSAYIDITNNCFNNGWSDYTISLWFNTNTYAGAPAHTFLNTDPHVGFGFGYNYHGSQRIYHWKGSNPPTSSWDILANDQFNFVPVNLNTWYHVVIVKNGLNYSYYINGVLDKTTVTTIPAVSNYCSLRIGAITSGGVPAEFWSGGLDDIGIWSKALNTCEIKQLYNSVAVPPPTGSAVQSFCTSDLPTVASLIASGTDVKWYDSETGISPLVSTTALVNGMHYWASQTVGACESPDRLDVTAILNPVYLFNETHSICNGQTYAWHGQSLTAAGTFYDNRTSVNGCDSTYTLSLTVNPTYAFPETQTICSGDSLLWQGAYRKTAGVHNANYTTVNGCDSTFALTLNLNPVYAYTESHSICNGQTYAWHGQSLTTAGTFYDNQTSMNGCDSTYTLTLNVNPTYTFTETQAICSGDSLLWQGSYRKTAGVHNANYTTVNSCDSTYALTLNLNPTYAFTETQALCSGDSLLWQGAYRKTSGVHTANYLTTLNCDSTYTLNLTLNSLPVVSFSGLNSLYCVYDPSATLTGSPAGGTFSGTGISGNTFDPNAAGAGTFDIIYSYTDGNSCTYSDTNTVVVDLCIGINNINATNLSIYPNPSTGAFTLQLDESASIEIYAAQGSLVYAEKFESGKHDLKLNVAEGVYLLKASNDKGNRNLRIVINR